MDHPEGAGETGDGRLGFDRRVRLEFLGTQLSSDGGLLVMRELDDVLGLSDLASGALNDNRRGKNTVHRIDGLFRQSVYGRLAGMSTMLTVSPLIPSCARLWVDAQSMRTPPQPRRWGGSRPRRWLCQRTGKRWPI